jgi:hypothetical protein
MKIKFFLIFFFIVKAELLLAQCEVKNTAFKAGEIVTYSAAYNWGFIWVDAGRVSFKVFEQEFNGQNAYYFKSTGTTLKKYDWIYKVRDVFEAWADTETLKPLKAIRNTSEGDYKVLDIYHFDHNQKKIYANTSNSKKKPQKDTLKLGKCTFDLLTAIYYARNIRFENYKTNDKIPISFVIDNEIFNLKIKFLGKETITTKDNRTFRCLKFTPELVAGTIFDEKSDMTVWVTDDKNRLPVLVEAKVLVGYVKALLISTEGLRYPLSSEVK